MTYSEQLSEFFSNLKYEDIPKAKIQDLKDDLLDYISCLFAGITTESGRIAAKFARDFADDGKCTVLGLGYQSSPYNAAFANAILSHSTELDDVDQLAYFHNAPPTASATIAAAEWVNASGKDTLLGLAVGFEMVNRLSECVNPMLRNRGFHTTPSCGVFGAGAGAAKVLGLSAEQTVSALGLCGFQASGLMEFYGKSMAKRFNPGPAARNGVTAAIFAQRGFTGAETVFEGERGFCRAFAGEYNIEKLTENLGTDWRFHFEYKPYACARPIHNAVDCAYNIMREHRIDVDQIESIVIERHPEWAGYHDIPEPVTYHEAQVSIQFPTALALVLGKVSLDQFCEETLHNEQIMRISKLTSIKCEPSLPRGVSCNMIMTMKNGDVHTSQVDYPKGSLQNPMTTQEHIDKFVALSKHLLSEGQQEKVIETIDRFETLSSVSEFISLVS